jgi:hypothetical protein
MRAQENQEKSIHEESDLNEQRQKLQVLGQFAGGIAHDFNNILSIIEGYAHIIRRGKCSTEDVNTNLEKIIATAKRGAGITRQLLMFGRQSVGLEKVFDLNEFIRGQKDFLETAIDNVNSLEVKTCKENAYIECDPNGITQILLNMAVNARDAMPSGGTFKIETTMSAHKGQAYIQLKVSDTGVGIPAELVDTIFEPFFTTKDQGQGTGLGLSTVFGIVDQMGGQIFVSSSLNEGTEFDIFLPLSTKKPMEDVLDAPIDRSSLSGKTVLLAEDEPDLRDVLCTMLNDLDLNVITAGDGNEALALQEDHDGEIDFLLTDVVMPNMSGQKLSELFLSLRPETKVIYMSGYPYGHNAVKNLNKEIPFISKPLEQPRLQRVLNECLGKDGFKSKH